MPVDEAVKSLEGSEIPTGEPDVFEGGLIPSQEPSPPDVYAAPVIPEGLAESLGGIDPGALAALIQAATAGQRAELDAVRQQLAEVQAQVASGAGGEGGMLGENASIGGYPWMYWRLPQKWPNEEARGWVTYGPGGATPKGNRDTGSYALYLRKGMVPITRYGYVEPPKDPEGWKMFIPMLKRGGAQEFPASQVVSYKWHIRPPLAGLTFPRYEAVKAGVRTYICEACGDQRWFLPEYRLAGVDYRAHLTQAHKYPFREAAEAIRNAGLVIAPHLVEAPIGSIEDAMVAVAPV